MIFAILLLFALAIILMIFIPAKNSNWAAASRHSANLVAPAQDDPEAKIQIYSAKAFSWRGRFSLHSWIAVKKENATTYVVYQDSLWNKYRGIDIVSADEDLPDRYWYGSKPEIIFSASGDEAKKMIPQIEEAITTYPYHEYYQAYPGPNSNTFISHIIREVAGITISLPSNAMGKDYLGKRFFAISESGNGVQFSFYGIFGLILDLRDGFEVNIIGLSFGIDLLKPALKLPFIGRIGLSK